MLLWVRKTLVYAVYIGINSSAKHLALSALSLNLFMFCMNFWHLLIDFAIIKVKERSDIESSGTFTTMTLKVNKIRLIDYSVGRVFSYTLYSIPHSK